MPLFVKEENVDLYADDTTVHASNKDTKIVESKLQFAATDFKSYRAQNKTYIHVGKASVMLIGTRKKKRSMVDPIQIYIDNEIIQEVQNQKRLGFAIEKNFQLG